MTDAQALGQRLREAREAKELTLEQAERLTRIRLRFLEAIERGDYSLMTPVQTQGFLRNYAHVLGLDLDLVLSELDDDEERGGLLRRRGRKTSAGLGEVTLPEVPSPAQRPSSALRPASSRPTASAPSGPPPMPRPRRRRRRGLFGNIMIVLLAGTVVVALVLGVTYLFDTLAEEETPAGDGGIQPGVEAESILTDEASPLTTPDEGMVDALPDTPPPAASPSLEAGDVSAPGDTALTPAPSGRPTLDLTGDKITVVITLTQRTWLRVTVDGQVMQEGAVSPGESVVYEGLQSVSIQATNAAALRLTVNNQAAGTLGTRGEAYDETFTLEQFAPPADAPPDSAAAGPATPSAVAMASPLPSATTTASPTASPVPATLTFTPTPSPTPTITFTPVTPTITPTFATIPAGDESVFAPVEGAGTPAQPLAATPEPEDQPAIASETPFPTSMPTITPSVEPTAEPSLAPPDTALPSLTPAPTASPLPSETPLPPPSATQTQTPTGTWTPVPPSLTPTATLTWTPSPTPTLTPSVTPSPTRTLTPSVTPSPTLTPSVTPTRTPFPTRTPRPTSTLTPSFTPSPSPFLPFRFTRTPTAVKPTATSAWPFP